MIDRFHLFYTIFLDLNSFFSENRGMLLSYAITWLIFGAASAYMARSRGKNPYLWFVLGMLFGVFGILFLLFGPKAHKTSQDPNTIDITPQFDPKHKEHLWYYLDSENHQHGPMSLDALVGALRQGKVSDKTFVWNESLENWKPFGEFFPK